MWGFKAVALCQGTLPEHLCLVSHAATIVCFGMSGHSWEKIGLGFKDAGLKAVPCA